jgi:hypothetical protein
MLCVERRQLSSFSHPVRGGFNSDRQIAHSDCAWMADRPFAHLAADMPLRTKLLGLCDYRAATLWRN